MPIGRAGHGRQPLGGVRLSEREGRGRMTTQELEGRGARGHCPSGQVQASKPIAPAFIGFCCKVYTRCGEGRQGPTKPHV